MPHHNLWPEPDTSEPTDSLLRNPDDGYDLRFEQDAQAAREEPPEPPYLCLTCGKPATEREGLMPCHWCGMMLHQLRATRQTACWEQHMLLTHSREAMGLPARDKQYPPIGPSDTDLYLADVREKQEAMLRLPSRSVQRRIAAQKGEPAPQFDQPPLDLDTLEKAYEAAKLMRSISAAKRLHVVLSDSLEDWWWGYGKDESCVIEGTANHWRWLAMLILGLANGRDVPYDEDKPTPEVVPTLIAALRQAQARIEHITLDNEDLQRRLAGTEAGTEEVLRQVLAGLASNRAAQQAEYERIVDNLVEAGLESDRLQAENERLHEQLVVMKARSDALWDEHQLERSDHGHTTRIKQQGQP